MEKDAISRGLFAMMRGDVQEDLLELQGEIVRDIGRLERLQEDLRTGNREVIEDVLRDMLAETPQPEPLAEVIGELALTSSIEHQHMPLLDASVQARIPTWLYGEAGSGKSTAAEKVADKTGLEFRSISLSPTTSKSDLLGYRDATGQYRSTGFRDTYEKGGVFLFDEVDNAHPSSLAVMNHALANDEAEFPDGPVEKHPDTIIIAAANTVGKGATAQYVGRTVIDAATRDRFVYIPWDIDEAMEERLVNPKSRADNDPVDISKGGIPNPREWLKTVRENRYAINRLGIRHLVSTRAALYGVQLARFGMGRHWLEELCIYKGMPEMDRQKIRNEIKNPSTLAV